MYRFLATLAFLSCSVSALADDTVLIAEIPIQSLDDAQVLMDLGLNVSDVGVEAVTVHATQAELDMVAAEGFGYILVESTPPEDAAKGTLVPLGSYHNYDTMTPLLQHYADTYPAIVRMVNLGNSVQGRALWAMHITDSPDIEEDEPEFKYVSTMHGNEPVGTEMCLYLIDLLCTSYGSDADLTDLVNTTDIWIVPLMNPDGRQVNTRRNANSVDLNRAFPIFPSEYDGFGYDGEPLGAVGRQPEVRHIMEWTSANAFNLSANLHTGALLVNYPYDHAPGVPNFSDAPTPDDDLCIDLSLRYSMLNPPMFASTEFEDGISNGSEWFQALGVMQDWNYRYAGCIEFTLELSDVFAPAENTLPTFWNENRDSMIAYMEAVHIGARGIVTREVSGIPLNAKVEVVGNDQPVFTDPDVGDYHRLLLPGTYTLRFTAPNHIAKTVPDVVVTAGAATRVNVALAFNDRSDVDDNGSVNIIDLGWVVEWVLSETYDPAGDINNDDKVNIIDVQMVVNDILAQT
jgi:carboxypeptidase D